MATIAYSGATFTFPNLTAHPLAFDVTDASRGQVAEALTLTGILRRSQVDTLKGIWQAWRDARLPQEPPERTGAVGATVTVTASGPGYAWSNRAAWFNDAPSFEAIGSTLIRTTVSLVDANQALAVLLRGLEESEEESEALALGTETYGTAVVNLTERSATFGDLPQAEVSPAGAHVISGPLVVEEVRDVRGWVTAANLTNLETWVRTTATATPAANAWFPVSWTKPTARLKRNAGVISTVYDVAFTLKRIR
jgi:hypothetical protein